MGEESKTRLLGSLEPGYWVPIYHDPDMEKDREGLAILLRRVAKEVPDNCEAWEVEFQDRPGETFVRIIKSTIS